MTIGPEFSGKRANIESVALMDKQSQAETENASLLNFHSKAIKGLDTLEGRVFKNPLFKDFSTLHKKGIEILAGKYHKKEDKVGINSIYYLTIEGTEQYEGVFSDGLVVAGTMSGFNWSKRVLYLNDGFGERTYEIELTNLKKKLFSPKKIELQIPIEDGKKDKIQQRERVVMKKTQQSISLGIIWSRLEYYEGLIPQIDKHGGAKITLVEVLDDDLISSVKGWQEDKMKLEKQTDPEHINYNKAAESYEGVFNEISYSLNTLGRFQSLMKGRAMEKMIKEAVDLARQRSTLGLPVGHEVTEEATQKRQKAVTKRKPRQKVSSGGMGGSDGDWKAPLIKISKKE